MAYATPADFLLRFDCSVIGELLSTTGVGIPEVELLSNPRLLTALESASGEVEIACNFAKRYTPTELAALTGPSAEMLKSIVCDIAYFRILQFRQDNRVGDYYRDITKTAADHLDALRRGVVVFTIQPQIDAGLATNSRGGDGVGGAAIVRGCGGTIADRVGNHMYPQRGNRCGGEWQ